MDIREILEYYYDKVHRQSFIEDDPISIPHRFSLRQDIEIMGFFAAILAWGQRKTIIKSCNRLVKLMDGAPYDFIMNHHEKDLIPLDGFVHRTFNSTDLLGLIAFFRNHYQNHDTLEEAFVGNIQDNPQDVGVYIQNFHQLVMAQETTAPRTRKHIASPVRNSACKRINMYLRWMVRKDTAGIDFGVWQKISPAQLLCPLDVHVERNARRLGLIARKQSDWKTVLELTESLRQFDAEDPVRFDFALFGMGILNKEQPLTF